MNLAPWSVNKQVAQCVVTLSPSLRNTIYNNQEIDYAHTREQSAQEDRKCKIEPIYAYDLYI